MKDSKIRHYFDTLLKSLFLVPICKTFKISICFVIYKQTFRINVVMAFWQEKGRYKTRKEIEKAKEKLS